MARVTIPDELFDHYQRFAATDGRPLDDVITAQLTAFRDIPPGQRRIVLPAAILAHVEARCGGGQIRTPLDFVRAFDRLASVKFGAIDLSLSPGQLAEIQDRADREGRPVKEFVQRIYDALSAELFNRVGGLTPRTAEPTNAQKAANPRPTAMPAKLPAAPAPRLAPRKVAAPPPPPTKAADPRATETDEV